jgi:hypothetical protein
MVGTVGSARPTNVPEGPTPAAVSLRARIERLFERLRVIHNQRPRNDPTAPGALTLGR